MPHRRPDGRRRSGSGPADRPGGAAAGAAVPAGATAAAGAAQDSAIEAIVRRFAATTGRERWRLGRWTSAALRDPRLAPGLEAARDRAIGALDEEPGRRRRWDRASRPLHEALVEGARGIRTWRIAMLVCHLVAVLAIAGLWNGLPVPIAFAFVLLAPASAVASWGRGLAPLGAIHAALAAAVSDRLDGDDLAALRRSWQKAIEMDPPAGPPLLGVIGALAPSGVLVVAFFAAVVARLQ
ncbi:MAG TPA: hypothetical protein VFO78_11295 [Candidatus Limnocylindrales bacterium]|nr:hypothetical protein [Candidatus Limnocylindrales bacterium]